jgi:hypothetical protein
MRKIIRTFLCCCLVANTAVLYGLASKHAAYQGGAREQEHFKGEGNSKPQAYSSPTPSRYPSLVSRLEPLVQAVNLVVNGSFEEPAVTDTYQVFESIPGWTQFVGFSGIELQKNAAGKSFDGDQLLELDSFTPTGISQDVPTQPGRNYELSFAFSPRPGTGIEDNILRVTWNGIEVVTLSESGAGLVDTKWVVHKFTVTGGAGSATKLTFEDKGASSSFGTYIDAVSLVEKDAAPDVSILVDATKDGGVWWFPQAPPGPFDPAAPHQGKALADYLRSKGYSVTELGGSSTITCEQLSQYHLIVTVDGCGNYSEAELEAYENYVSNGGRLIHLTDHKSVCNFDTVGTVFDLDYSGSLTGIITTFTPHPITAGVTALSFIAGATATTYPAPATILGTLSGSPVMGIMPFGEGRLFFLGDTNGIEAVPQPFVDNLFGHMLDGARLVNACAGNSAPVANAGPDQNVPLSQVVQLDGSNSSDPDGDSLTFSWSFVSRPAGSAAALSDPAAAMPTFVAGLPGTYVVQLIVNDGQVNSAPDTVTITTANSVPLANAGPDQAVNVGATAQLDGSGSNDPDGDSLTFSWSFISKPTGSAAVVSNPTAVRPSFVADLAGTYVLQLIVNDGRLNSLPDTVTITAASSGQTIGCGDLISGTIAAAGEVDIYRFAGQAGQIISLALASTGGFSPRPGGSGNVALTLLAPSGAAVGGVLRSNSQANFTLPQTGTYVVRVSAFNLSTTGSYNLRRGCQ